MNNSVLYHVLEPARAAPLEKLGSYSILASVTTYILSAVWSQITIWRLLVLVLLLGNIKNIPLIWHVSTTVIRRRMQFLITSIVENCERFQILSAHTEAEGACHISATLSTTHNHHPCSNHGD